MDGNSVVAIAILAWGLGSLVGMVAMWWRMGAETDYWRTRAKWAEDRWQREMARRR